jgi:hypothetical protein
MPKVAWLKFIATAFLRFSTQFLRLIALVEKQNWLFLQ